MPTCASSLGSSKRWQCNVRCLRHEFEKLLQCGLHRCSCAVARRPQFCTSGTCLYVRDADNASVNSSAAFILQGQQYMKVMSRYDKTALNVLQQQVPRQMAWVNFEQLSCMRQLPLVSRHHLPSQPPGPETMMMNHIRSTV
jgi:hypothetical protein